MSKFGQDDFIAFYASLRPVQGGRLTYALIGLFVCAGGPRKTSDIPASEHCHNAHTRWQTVHPKDIVVNAKPEQSGLFERCIPIGEWRENAYRVRKELLEEWGGLHVRDGYIQRSANPPEFECPGKFRKWLDKQSVRFSQAQYRVHPTAAPTPQAVT